MKFLKPYFKYFLLFALLYMPVFGHLDTLPVRIWDEARLAINAYEMLNNKDFIVTHFDGKPDMWNTKPPLLIWAQVFFMKLIGVNELAVRLPSAIAAFLTCIVLLIFFNRYLKNFWYGFITIIVLITTYGYIDLHATRTGDYDALLTLFTTLSGLLFFAYTETKKIYYLYYFYLFTALAVLTKGISGLLFIPAILLYIIFRKQILPLLKSKHFYFGLLSFLVLTLGYYFLREAYNPGYIKAVWKNELGGRYFEVIENHEAGFWYYFNNLIEFRIPSWYLLIPCGLVMGLVIKNDRINKITFFSFLMVITYLIVISSAKTKLQWYDVPLFPFIAIMTANFIYYIFCFLQNFDILNQTLKIDAIPYLFIFLIAIVPYQKIFQKTYKPKEYYWEKDFYEIGYYLKSAVKGKIDVNHQFLLYDGYNTQNLFYLKILQDKGIQIAFKNWKNLDSSDVVFTHQNQVKEYIANHYVNEILFTNGNVTTYKIYGKK